MNVIVTDAAMVAIGVFIGAAVVAWVFAHAYMFMRAWW